MCRVNADSGVPIERGDDTTALSHGTKNSLGHLAISHVARTALRVRVG